MAIGSCCRRTKTKDVSTTFNKAKEEKWDGVNAPGLLEVWAGCDDFMDEIFNGENSVLAEVLLDDFVVGQRDSLLVDLSVTSLVDEFADGLEVGLAVCDVWLDDLQHVCGGLGDLDEDSVVDLEQAEELHDLSWLGCNLVDTVGSHRCRQSSAECS